MGISAPSAPPISRDIPSMRARTSRSTSSRAFFEKTKATAAATLIKMAASAATADTSPLDPGGAAGAWANTTSDRCWKGASSSCTAKAARPVGASSKPPPRHQQIDHQQQELAPQRLGQRLALLVHQQQIGPGPPRHRLNHRPVLGRHHPHPRRQRARQRLRALLRPVVAGAPQLHQPEQRHHRRHPDPHQHHHRRGEGHQRQPTRAPAAERSNVNSTPPRLPHPARRRLESRR